MKVAVGVVLMILREDMLMLLRRNPQDPTSPDTWALPTGLLVEDETPLSAAVRAVRTLFGDEFANAVESYRALVKAHNGYVYFIVKAGNRLPRVQGKTFGGTTHVGFSFLTIEDIARQLKSEQYASTYQLAGTLATFVRPNWDDFEVVLRGGNTPPNLFTGA